ncbi:MAG: hypothetical protein KC442_17850 [Thermomicrobiales bacterium]|nr:hypothetical protein [Thermomicrobiales bacterium]
MDDVRFDHIARSLHNLAPRRGALGLLLGGALGLAGLAESEAKKKGKKKKKQKQKKACQKLTQACGIFGCQFGARCCSGYNCDQCSASSCINRGKDGFGTCGCDADDGETFLNGRCGVKPECIPAGTIRSGNDIRCCSGSQIIDINDPENGKCLPGVLSCLSNADCTGGLCRGYVCAAATLECQDAAATGL